MVSITSQGYKPVECYDEDLVFMLPGQGQPYEWCGKWYYIGHFADTALHWIRRKRSCHRYECPVCWHDWQHREARAIARRLHVYSEMWHRRMVHYVLSPPDDVPHTLKGFRAARKDAYRIARSRGIRGGVMIYHERACRFYDERAYTETHGGFRGCHFHVVGDGWLKSTAELYEKDGWIVKNIGIREAGGTYKTANYLLDHCLRAMSQALVSPAPLARVRLNTVTWFGVMAYNKLRISMMKGENLVHCPVCEEGFPASQWFILDWQGVAGPPEGDHGESVEGQDEFVLDRPLINPFWG
jgi:hypothetical protein